jgi:hypothetical protein
MVILFQKQRKDCRERQMPILTSQNKRGQSLIIPGN